MQMKRFVAGSAVLVLAGACQTAPRKGPAPGPGTDFLRPYVGQQRILRFQGDRERVVVEKKAGAPLSGTCDVAVQVRTATLEKGAPVLTLETLGTVGTEKGTPRCTRIPAAVTFRLKGFEADPAEPVAARIDQVLPEPDAYLRARGVAFDLAAGAEPAVAGAREGRSNTTDDERRLGRRITTPPRRLMWVDPIYHHPTVRHQAEVELDVVVGADGRVYRPQIRGSLSADHQAAIRRSLGLWRFEPARAGAEPVPAYQETRLVFTIR